MTAGIETAPNVLLKPVITLGYGADLHLASPIHLHFGVQYSPKGFQSKLDFTDSTYIKSNLSLHYLEIPISLVLTAGRAKARMKPYVSAGMYGGLGIYGRNIKTSNLINPKTKRADSTFTAKDKVFGQTLRRFDYGVNLEVGVQTRMVQVGFTYGMGLNNLNLGKGEAIRNRTWGIFVNVFFDDMF